MSLERVHPLVCSRCHKPVMVAAVFLACNNPERAGNRGASRNIRVCQECLRELLAEFAPPKETPKGKR